MSVYFAFLMFPVLAVFVFSGIPVAFSLLSTALVFGMFRFGDVAIVQVAASLERLTTSYAVAAIPLFVLMGAIIESSGIAARIFDNIYVLTRRLPGGVAVGAIILCTIFAAASGITGATESIVGILAVPAMMRYRYDNRLISGTICAGGSLGTIIPPSVLAIILAPVAGVQVGDLMAGIAVPGLILSVAYIVFIIVSVWLFPALAPRENGPRQAGLLKLLFQTTLSLLPPISLIVAVLGSIMFGIATTTEAAAVGCLGAVFLAATNRRLTLKMLWDSAGRAMIVSVAIVSILFGGMVFSAVFIASGGMSSAQTILLGFDVSPGWLLAIVLGLGFMLGMVLDQISIIFIVIPIATPILKMLGIDPLYFCVLFMLILQTSYLTPPLAPAIFYFRAISPPEIKLTQMYAGVVPFIAIQILLTVFVAMYPELATYLPSILYPLR